MISVLVWAGYVAGVIYLAMWARSFLAGFIVEKWKDDFKKDAEFLGPGMPNLFYGLVLLMMAAFLDHSV